MSNLQPNQNIGDDKVSASPVLPRLSLQMPVTKVVAYEDRADVTRQARMELPSGPLTLVLPGLSPLIHPDHLVVRVTTQEGDSPPEKLAGQANLIAINDVEVKHRYQTIASQVHTDQKVLQEQIDAAFRNVAAAETERNQAAIARNRLLKMVRTYAERLGQTTWAGQGSAAQWQKDFAALRSRLDGLDVTLASRTKSYEVARLESSRLQTLQHAADKSANKSAKRLVADVVLQLVGVAGPVEVALQTVLPCALWRPAHEARLGHGAIDWRVFGTLWQKTGEDWHNVEVQLSTRRPSAGAHLPALEPDVLRTRTKTQEERRTISVQHRSEEVASDDADGGVPGVYDGGEVREFVPAEKVTLKSDGRPHRVQVAQFESAAILDRVAMPDENLRVYLRAKLQCALDQPLLAGPVTLLQDGEWVGIGDVRYVGAREAFEIAFGTDDRFVVRRRRRSVVEKRTLAKDRVHFVTEVDLSSSASTPEQVQVVLRLPLSEVKQLKVVFSEAHCSAGIPELDANGFAHLPVALEAGEQKTIKVGFYFDATSAVSVPDPW